MYLSLLTIGLAASAVNAHGVHEQKSMAGPLQSLWYNRLPGDGGTQVSFHLHVSARFGS